MDLFRIFLHDQRGDLAQYALILLLVVVVTVTVLTDLGVDISTVIGDFDSAAFGGSGGGGTTGGGDSGGGIGIEPGPDPIPISP